MLGASFPAHGAVSGLPFTDANYAHILGSAYITEVGKDQGLNVWENVALVVAIGVVKELYDSRTTGFNAGDIGYNVLGVVLSYSVEFTFDWMNE